MTTSLCLALLTWAAMRLAHRYSRLLGLLAGWPSTVLHELAHFILATLVGSKPSRFSVWPQKIGPDAWQLGAVAFHPRTWSAALVALAPLVWTPVAYWVVTGPHLPLASEVLSRGLFGGVLLGASIPSSVDFHIAAKYPAGLVWLVLGGYFVAGTWK